MRWFALVFISIVFVSMAACSRDQENTSDPEVSKNFPDQESWNAVLTITNDGKKVGVVHAAYMQKFTTKKITLVSKGLQVDFYNSQGKHTSVLNSEGGKVYDNKQDMLAYGNVVVKSDSGTNLYSDTLIWDNKKQKIISHVPVKITSPTDTIFGDTFVSDANLENYEITNSSGTSSDFFRKTK